MISCLLIQVSRNQQGLPVSKENVIVGESIQIGRGAACKIHLLDHRVALLHATLRRSEDGTLYIEGEKDEAIHINGFIEQSAAISPGTRVEIGPYLMLVEPAPAGHDIALSVEMMHPLAGQDKTHVPVTLDALKLSNRKLGLGLAAAILFMFLLLPFLPSVSPAFDTWQAILPVSLNQSWNLGPLSGGHGVIGTKCSICHQSAFHSVSDAVCLGCHKQIKLHLAKDEIHADAIKNMRCTECHLDHRGHEGILPHNSSKCVACHADIKKKNISTTLADVHEFDKDHPQFRVMLQSGKERFRVSLDDKEKLVEKSGLKFSHQVHLDKNGVSSPQGDTVMVCRDCHKIEESGIRFAPMMMQKTCQQSHCHSLLFMAPAEGFAPHGSERAVMDSLRKFYTNWLAGSPKNMAECGRAGGAGTAALRALNCANELAQKNAGATLFGDKLECGECHEIQPAEDKEAPWAVAKVHINRDWQPKATFVHAKHDTMNCTECHDKINSKTSAEVSMPRIEKCRECHVGDVDAKGKIRSDCDSCHRFHRSDKSNK